MNNLIQCKNNNNNNLINKTYGKGRREKPKLEGPWGGTQVERAFHKVPAQLLTSFFDGPRFACTRQSLLDLPFPGLRFDRFDHDDAECPRFTFWPLTFRHVSSKTVRIRHFRSGLSPINDLINLFFFWSTSTNKKQQKL